MSYIDGIDDAIKSIEGKVRALNKIKREYKKEKQKYCHHLNLVRFTRMPRLSYVPLGQDVVFNTIQVRTKCKDCGKVLS